MRRAKVESLIANARIGVILTVKDASVQNFAPASRLYGEFLADSGRLVAIERLVHWLLLIAPARITD